MNFILFLSSAIAVLSTVLWINNIVVDISSAIMSMYSQNTAGSEEDAKAFAKYRIKLAIVMGISWGLVICL